MSAVPNVSVIMNCRNSAEYLHEAMSSVASQTFQDWEIVFFDNQSTDKSPEIAQSFGEKVRYLRAEKPLSLGEARNQAIAQARGELIAFLDCDDVWFPQKLEKQVRIFDQDPTIGFAYSNYFNFYQSSGRETVAQETHSAEGDLFAANLSNYHVGILTVVLRRSILEKLDHWFDPKLSLAEDLDLFLRAMAITRSHYNGEALAKYRIHSSNLSLTQRTGWVEEFQHVLDKLARAVPDFERKYSREVEGIRGRMVYMKAKGNLLEGRTGDARRILKPYRFKSKLLLASYLSSFLPGPLWGWLYGEYLKRR